MWPLESETEAGTVQTHFLLVLILGVTYPNGDLEAGSSIRFLHPLSLVQRPLAALTTGHKLTKALTLVCFEVFKKKLAVKRNIWFLMQSQFDVRNVYAIVIHQLACIQKKERTASNGRHFG